MSSPWVWLCVGATLTLVVGPAVVRPVAKGVASFAFLAQAVHAGALEAGLVGGLLIAALKCSVIGDLCLLSKAWFRAGIAAFGLAHVAFCAVFLALGVSVPATAVALVAVGGFGFAVSRTLSLGGLQRAVEAYAAVLCAMTALAVGVAAQDPARWPVLVAAVAFLVSDLFVARERFVAPAWSNRAVGLPLYYGAQLVFATVIPAGGG